MTNLLSVRGIIMMAVLMAAFATGCKKDENGSSYYVKFKAAGNPITYSQQSSEVATFDVVGSQYHCAISGAYADASISIGLFDTTAIVAKTYDGLTVLDSSYATIGTTVSYNNGNGITYSSGIVPAMTVTVSEITADYVKGTFSGHVAATSGADIAITEGEFYVKRQ